MLRGRSPVVSVAEVRFATLRMKLCSRRSHRQRGEVVRGQEPPGASSPIGSRSACSRGPQLARVAVHHPDELRLRIRRCRRRAPRPASFAGLEHEPAQEVGDRQPLARPQAELRLDRGAAM